MLPLSTEVISQPILRTYISYARQYVKPKLSAKAAAILQKYYLELRSKNKQFGSIPIFNRQLEAMIRLTEVWYLLLREKNILCVLKKYFISLYYRLEQNWNYVLKQLSQMH